MTSLSNVAEIAAAAAVEFQGLRFPAAFTTTEDECRALREGIAVYDGSFRGWLRAVGEDRVTFLQGMLTNDVSALEAPVYAALLTQQGKVVSDLRVHGAPDHLLLDLPAHAVAAARTALERYIVADDVELEPAEAALIGVEGPQASRLLAGMGVPWSQRWTGASVAGHAVQIAPGGHAGESGIVIGCAAADAPAVWRVLRDAGAHAVGLRALDVARVEAGIPWVGVDMDEDTLIMEADIPDAISFKKGCYLGQEVVERIAARGHVNRRRVGLAFDGDPVPPRAALLASGAEVGWVTSSVRSPALGRTVGMGYVRREHLAEGTPLDVSGGGSARVAALPFVRRGAG